MSKSIFTSKLFWLGVIQVLIGILELVKTNVLSTEQIAWGALVTGIVTVILRALSTQAVYWTKPK